MDGVSGGSGPGATRSNDDLGIPGIDAAEPIGRGGFAIVYRARQGAFNRTVAVKVLSVSVSDEDRSLYARELAAMGTLTGHPNIVTVFSSGFTADGRPYMVLEYLPEGSLAERLRRSGPLPWPEAVSIGVRLAEALAAAHLAGVLHRDVKPENVLMSTYGQPKLADFGIARMEGGAETRGAMHLTLSHAAPELIDGGGPSVASDIYALASTVMHMIRGRPPFSSGAEHDTTVATLKRIAHDPPPDLRPLGVPDTVCTVLERGLAKLPEQRQPSAAAFAWELYGAAPSLVPRPSLPPSGEPRAPVPSQQTVAATTPFAPPSVTPAVSTGSGPGTGSPATTAAPSGVTTAPPPTPGSRRRPPPLLLGLAGGAIVAVAAVGVVLATHSGGSRPSPQSSPGPSAAAADTAATSQTETQTSNVAITGSLDGAARAVLLGTGDLPGYAPGPGAAGAPPEIGMPSLTFCNTHPDFSKRSGEADAMYHQTDSGPFVTNSVASFAAGAARPFMEAIGSSIACGTYTDELGSSVDVKTVDGANLADQTLRIRTTVNTLVGTSTDLYVLIRKGDVVTLVDYSTLGSDVSSTEAIAAKAAARLNQLP